MFALLFSIPCFSNDLQQIGEITVNSVAKEAGKIIQAEGTDSGSKGRYNGENK